MKKNGHYCKVCGRYRANEKFTGKGHATHICKDCAKLPPEVKAEQETLNRLSNLPWYLSKAQKDWLKNRTKDRRPEVKALAQEQNLKKLPTVKSLQAEYAQLLSEKKAMYADYQKAREDMRSLQTAKANVDRILGDNSLTAERETEKDGR